MLPFECFLLLSNSLDVLLWNVTRVGYKTQDARLGDKTFTQLRYLQLIAYRHDDKCIKNAAVKRR